MYKLERTDRPSFAPLVAAIACAFASVSQAAEVLARHFDIPPQAVQSALNEFARQSDRQILFSTDAAAKRRTDGVKGDLEPEAALKELLRGTGLTFRVTADRSILVETAQTSDAPGSNADSIEEILVTATRRAESLREVAQSVTALPERVLVRLQANDFQDYAKLVPGLQISTPTPGASQVILRGLSSLNSASTTGIYVDNTPYGSSSGLANGKFLTADLNAFDLERIEVLRGPQGTLYGASTMGGLLKFVTNAPDRTRFSSRVQLNAEDVKGERGLSARGMLNVPLGERAAVRLTALRTEEPGYIDDPTRGVRNLNDTTSTGVRASLLVQINDAASLRLTSVGQNNELKGANDVDLAVDASDPARAPIVPYRPLYGDLQHSRSFAETNEIEYRVHNATLQWSLGDVALTSATSYGTYRQDALVDLTLLDGLFQSTASDLNKFTQEFQFTSRSDRDLEWIAGLYYTRETGSIGQRYTNFVYDGSALEVDSKFQELAAFATLTYKFTSQFDVAVGMRAARNEQEVFQHGTVVFADFASQEESAENVVLYSVAPRFRASDTTTVYARLASGYRPGGPNIIALGNPENAPRSYDSDTVVSIEAGIKADMLERRLALDVSAYYLRWKDLQLTGTVNSTSVMSNAGEANSQGVEWAAQLRAFKGFSIELVGAYTDATLTESTAEGTELDHLGGRKGDALPYVSKWTALIGANYEWPALETATAYVGASWNYIGARRTDFGSAFGHQLELPSYETVDARLGLDFERWSVGLYGKNLTDERGVAALGQSASPGGGGVFDADAGLYTLGSTFLVIRPRTLGMMLSVRF